jgi:acyl-CoA dehydrogenase
MTTTASAAIADNLVIEQADRLLARHVTTDELARADRGEWLASMWKAVQEAGLPLALVPEAQGGVELASADALRLIRRTGYHTLPLPLAETMIAAALWAQASGEEIEAPLLSLAPVRADDSLIIEHAAGGYVLRGSVRRVPWGSNVAHVLLHVRDARATPHLALLAAASVVAEPRRNLANEPRPTLKLDGVLVAEAAIRPAPPACADGFLAFGALVRAQQMAGAIERALEHALEYAMQRKQFGRPIGKFQAVQQMLAEAAGQYAAATAAADLALAAYGRDDFAFAAALAKARVGEAAGKVAEVCHQVFAAMGFTQEHPLHYTTRRLWAWRDEFGNETYWQAKIGEVVCARGGEALWTMLAGD